MDDDRKIVHYDKYCRDCKHWEVSEFDDPCNECMCTPVNVGTHQPINFVERSEK